MACDVVNQKDVEVSYGFAAVAAVLAYRFRGRPQKLYVAVLVAYVGVSLAVDHSFSNWGHLAALAIGFASYPIVRRHRARVTSCA